MDVRPIFLVLFLVVLFASGPAHADSHDLTVRQLWNAEYEAVITYDSDSFCDPTVNPPSSVQIVGFEVRIESPPLDKILCIEPTPPIITFEATANIGTLEPDNYTVTWVQPNSFSLSASLVVSGMEGPFVPCVSCDTLTQAPYPETGAWYNPAQSGSGINLEIQNGKLVGFYYGYDAEGRSEWQLFSGMLVRSEQQGVQWELKTPLQQFKNGNCSGCEYQPPDDPIDGATISLEFQQRNYMRLTIGDNPSQFYVPIIYGSTGHRYFSEQTPYTFPEYGADFVLITKPNSDPPEPWKWKSLMTPVGKGSVIQGGPDRGKLIYKTWIHSPPPGPDVFIRLIECELEAESGQPGCILFANGKEYVMPIANMSDTRFFGEAADGSTVEGYRLDYD